MTAAIHGSGRSGHTECVKAIHSRAWAGTGAEEDSDVPVNWVQAIALPT